MLFLFISIVLTVSNFLTFKLFSIYKVHSFQAIAINYLVCLLIGFGVAASEFGIEVKTLNAIAPYGILLGINFILIFNILNICTGLIGVASTTIVSRMSMVVPVIFSVYYYHEPFEWLTLIAIILAITSIFLTVLNRTKKEMKDARKPLSLKRIGLPIIAFMGVGFADSFVKFTQESVLKEYPFEWFLVFVFGTAATIGLAITVSLGKASIKKLISRKTILWGIALGVANYGSMYFFVKALGLNKLSSAVIFPINSVSIVAVSGLAAVLFFKERMNLQKLLGFILAISSIVLLSLS
jgi:drug/metabolite transporter (DMT)-like permease